MTKPIRGHDTDVIGNINLCTGYDFMMDLDDYVNKLATLFGIAENTAGGAILRCGVDSHVYIEGLSEWDEIDQYAAFEVTGTLVEEGCDADLRTDEGAVLHGLGRHYVLKRAIWERIS
ncbi:hypothetical protein ACFYO1_02320 [Nocardia sp. NPDC006044]|uniref:hypothetical protein n=1 Tax=Nocardia sp. NPDC006044 TaxID=3364306 RepID=UPI0036C662AD